MLDYLPFVLFFSCILIQRAVELFIAKGNEKWMKQQGAIEFGKGHYRYMVLMHILFLVIFLSEKFLLNRGLSQFWPWVLALFCLTQVIRFWAISSLGRYWNTKIIVLPGACPIKKGPYRFMKHPNYFVVTIELAVIPILFTSYYSAFLFSIFNMILLWVRVNEEEKALSSLTDYAIAFQDSHRFIPKFVK